MVANAAVAVTKMMWTAFIVKCRDLCNSSGERFLPCVRDSVVKRRSKHKLAPAFKHATPLTLPGLTNPSNQRTRVKAHSSVFWHGKPARGDQQRRSA